MLQFIIGLLVGGLIGFATCAVCSVASAHDRAEELVGKKTDIADVQK